MTSERRFEQDVPDLLWQVALGPTPDYRDHIVQETAGMRQRPAWSFPERWLPVSAITSRTAAAPRVPWRIVGLVALLLVALAVGAVLISGSKQQLPAPFGPAANGQVAYDEGGDILTVDPVSGVVTAVVTGPELDREPVWSRNGTRLAFVRTAVGTVDEGRLFVAKSDGSELLEVTSIPQLMIRDYAFSADGGEIVFTSGPEGSSQLWMAKTDGSAARQLEVGMEANEPTYAPPNGAEIAFASRTASADGSGGIYAVNVATGTVRTIVEPSYGVDRGWIRFSPDGSRIAYSASTPDSASNSYRVHVVGADGKGDIVLPLPTGALFQDTPEWSNDGTRLVVTRGYAAHNEDMTVAIVPADGSGVGLETKHGLTGCCDTLLEWAPDDTSILIRPEDLDGNYTELLVMNPSTGAFAPASWAATSKPAWQRRAP